MSAKLLVSACLLGQPVRWDGRAKTLGHAALARWQAQGRLVPVCPELLGGFGIPRPRAELEPGIDAAAVLAGRGRIFDEHGADVTAAFVAGARAALRIAQREAATLALLTDGSPSCGVHGVADGHFAQQRVPGQGVAAALLAASGLRVFAATDIDALIMHMA
jgi:uncharacterized protein YbbK (DUF523 family)